MSDRAAELSAALLAADTPAAILSALGAAIAHNEGRPDRAPDPAALAAYLIEWECPEADELLGALYGAPAAWGTTTMSVACAYAADDEPLEPCAAVYAPGEPRRLQSLRLLADVHAAWCAADPRPRHPLAPLVDGWQEAQPVESDHETRADRRIMPVLRVVGPSPEREHGHLLFGGLVDDRPREANLLLFP